MSVGEPERCNICANCPALRGCSRRDFLIRSSRGAPALLAPSHFWKLAFADGDVPAVQSSAPPEFHLHPHYRSQLALEATLRKTAAGPDDFIRAKCPEQIQSIHDAWRSGAREYSPS